MSAPTQPHALVATRPGDSDPNADEALRRVRQSDARPLPTDTRARRRVIAQRGW